ncbi:hypothetical protein [Bosea sp. (in: a-proteobacteria)]|uniref:hypothetical protein n=1 Tax=Bosea sp. (in: a-proteobacteria) TaxID=1871050 RepID=UPI002735E89C|nr:hypothetical protein [Bosea sp. (in: a-proteobacteria)]MDP3410227.1 hypothetical protein [Bosea sp. (in: a-proteobacteria)]
MAQSQAERMTQQKAVEYQVCQYGDDGELWTVVEIVKRSVAKVASRGDAISLAARLQRADKART